MTPGIRVSKLLSAAKPPPKREESQAKRKRRQKVQQASEQSILKPKNKVGFDDLSEDVHREVFKYLGVKDQLRLEAINKQFGRVLKDQWKSRRVLAFGSPRYQSSFQPLCSRSDHQLSPRDWIWTSSVRGRQILIERCTNLRVLVYDRRPCNSVASAIAQHCPRIEHIDGLNDDALKVLKDHGFDSVACIRSRRGCVQSLQLKPINFGIAERTHASADIRNMDQPLAPCDSVRTLYWPHFNINRVQLDELIKNLPQLMLIRSRGTFTHQVVNDLPAFEEIRFTQDLDELLLKRLLEKSGHMLRKLWLLSPMYVFNHGIMEFISNKCPNLEHMTIPLSILDGDNYRYFRALKKLQSLSICRCYLEPEIGKLCLIIKAVQKVQHMQCWDLSNSAAAEILTATVESFSKVPQNRKRRLNIIMSTETLRSWIMSQSINRSLNVPDGLTINSIPLNQHFATYKLNMLTYAKEDMEEAVLGLSANEE